MKNERNKKQAELQTRLADETRLAIEEQEKQMGLLIGRLQAGAARRQAIIKNNEETMNKLQVWKFMKK